MSSRRDTNPVAGIMSHFAQDQYGGSQATILVNGEKASYVGAVLANGFAANALDIDDGHFKAKGHPGAVILPSLLTFSEMPGAKLTGKDFLTALVVGNELDWGCAYALAIRAGTIRHETYTQVYHSTGSWVPLGVAGAGGSLLGLSQDVTWHAMGTGEYHAALAPMMKGITVTSMTKDSMGWGAMVGVSSILMAQKGFTGIQPLFVDAPDPQTVKNLGQHWEMMDLFFKPYAACRWAHPAIAGALLLHKEMRDQGLGLDSIQKIEITAFGYATEMRTTHPKDTEEAQYNIAYPVAAALVDGEVGPRQVLPPRITDKDILALADKVELKFDQWMEDQQVHPGGKYYSDVCITTTDGQTMKSGKVLAKWDPHEPPTDKELEEKFRWLVAPVLGRDRADKLVDMIWKFENVENVGELIRMCVKGALQLS